MLDKITFKPQTGRCSQSFVIMTEDINKMANLSSLNNEAELFGTDIILLEIQLDCEGQYIRSMKFGLGPEIKKTQVHENCFFPNFFSPGRVYEYLIVTNDTEHECQLSGGITPAGTDLFSCKPIAANGTTAIQLDRPFDILTPIFIHDGGQDDTWNDSILSFKTVSRKI